MTFGPVTWQELRRIASTGELLPSDAVGHVGMPKSMRAGRVPGLFAPNDQSSSSVETVGTGVNAAAVTERQGRSEGVD